MTIRVPCPIFSMAARSCDGWCGFIAPAAAAYNGAAMALGLVLATRMHERVIYAETFAHGKTAIEIDPAGVAGRELAALWLAVKERIH
ncbi:MAG: hypothetical protein P8173_17140 [Gammaproteobacteria bacterium]